MKRKMNDEDCLNWDSISECFGNRMVSIFREYLCLSLEQKDTIWEPQSKVLKDCGYIREKYDLIDTIGDGSFGEVYKVRSKKTHKLFAAKKYKNFDEDVIMEKKRLEDADLLNDDETLMAYNEIKLLQSFDHEDIIHTHGVYHGKHANSVYLVMDLCEVNLYTVLLNGLYSFSSREIKYIMYHLYEALSFIHHQGYVHLYFLLKQNNQSSDVKPSNILYHNGHISLIDFGLCHKSSSFASFADSDDCRFQIGTQSYQPIELFAKQRPCYFTQAIDIWSAAITFLELLSSKSLFEADGSIQTMMSMISLLGSPTKENCPLLQDPDSFYGFVFKFIPSTLLDFLEVYKQKGLIDDDGIDLIVKSLDFNYQTRITIDAILSHPYFTKEPLLSSTEMPDLQPAVQQFRKKQVEERNKYIAQLKEIFGSSSATVL